MNLNTGDMTMAKVNTTRAKRTVDYDLSQPTDSYFDNYVFHVLGNRGSKSPAGGITLMIALSFLARARAHVEELTA